MEGIDQNEKTLLFVYKVKPNNKSAIMEAVQRVFRPAKDSCSLYAITHGIFGERWQWKRLRRTYASEGYGWQYMHGSEFERSYKSKFGYAFTYPVILMADEDGLSLVADTVRLGEMKGSQALKAHLRKTLFP